MWLQYRGYSDAQVGKVVLFWTSGGIVGSIIGGYGSDSFYMYSRWYGRQSFAQLTCASMVITAIALFGTFHVLPLNQLVFLFGIFEQPWTVGCIRPLLCEVAKKGQVASMIAWKMTHVNVLGLLIGPALIERFASRYGFVSSGLKMSEMPDELRQNNAAALQSMLLSFVGIGYAAIIVLFGLLNATYPLDLQDEEKEHPQCLDVMAKVNEKGEHMQLINGKTDVKSYL